jgi:hypothetical protein
MISNDLACLSDRMAGYALHGTAPTRDELGMIAAELLKFSRIVETMENLPLDVTLQLLEAVPEYPLVRAALGSKP